MTGDHAFIRNLFYQHLEENNWLPKGETPYYVEYNQEIKDKYKEWYKYYDKPLKYAGFEKEDISFIQRFGNKK